MPTLNANPATHKVSLGTIFYDGSCSLCQKEIASLKRAGCALDLKDIHTEENLPASKQVLLKQLHAITGSGEIFIGFDANLFMWRHGHYAWLARMTSLPGLYTLTKAAYNSWAKWRYVSRYGRSNSCEPCSKPLARGNGSSR